MNTISQHTISYNMKLNKGTMYITIA
ncbi:MAG: hypothetical protein PWR12_1939, partial [Eubacteriaceae bacterium]|nr:hypothetical protein [Eubacteriaceae bacterium]